MTKNFGMSIGKTHAIIGIILAFVLVTASVAHASHATSKISPELTAQINSAPSKETTVLFTAQPGEDLDDLAEKVERNGGKVIGKYEVGDIVVAKMRPRGIITVAGEPEILNAWPRKTYYAMLDQSVPQVGASAMWDAGYTGSNVKIAIIDTGIDKNHPMVAGKVISEAVFTGEASANDVHGHGTHVAGTAAGNGPLKGVAPDALLMNAKALSDKGEGSNDGIIAAINWAVDPDGDESTDDGADVISMSLGGIGGTDDPLNRAVKEAISRGVVVVIASGNCGSPGYCPGNFVGVTTPGNTEEAITVGAVDENNNWASFSSGEDFGTYIKPDIVAPGVRINSSAPGGKYVSIGGTSMATPHVAGAAALLLQYNPSLDHFDIKYILEKTARPFGPPGKDTKYGSGVLSIDQFLVPSIDRFVKYRTDVPEFVSQNEPIPINVNLTIYGVTNISLTVFSPSDIIYEIPMANTSENSWSASFTDTAELGRYTLQFQVKDIAENIEAFNETVMVIPSQDAYGEITAVYADTSVSYTVSTPVTVEFANRWNSVMNTVVEMQILYNNSLISSEKITAELSPLEERNFTFNFTSKNLGGNLIRFIATYPAGYDMEEWIINVIDDVAPEASEVVFKRDLVPGEPFMVEFIVSDASAVNATAKVSGIESSMSLAYTIGDEHHLRSLFMPDAIGEHPFELKVCDKQNLCTDYTSSFTVAQCNKPPLLIVEDRDIRNDTGIFVETLHQDYCLAVWDTSFGLPQSANLNNFGGVAWLVGTGSGLDPETTHILSAYDGKLYVQGDTIAQANRYDDVLRRVLYSEFYGWLEENISTVHAAYTHPVLSGFEIFDINRSLSNPTAISPIDGGVTLASFGNSSAIVASGNDKTIFSTLAASSIVNNMDNFIRNVADWLSEDSNLDVSISDIGTPWMVEGENEINVTLDIEGGEELSEVLVSYFVDGQLEGAVNVQINSQRVYFAINPMLSSGNHKLRLFANHGLTLKESNYLNNEKTLDIFVAGQYPDLIVKEIDYAYSSGTLNLSATVSNIGGTDAESSLDLFIDGQITASFNFSIGKGDDKKLSKSMAQQSGIYEIRATVDPLNIVTESNESNNELTEKSYLCDKQHILLVNDSDTYKYSGGMPSSAHLFESVLRDDGYCVEVNDGRINANGDYDLIVWSAGDYYDRAIDENDASFLQGYNRILFEGSEIGYDHVNDEFIRNKMHAELYFDMALNNDIDIILTDHPIFENITNLKINKDMSPYPDSLLPYDGESVAEWPEGGSAIIMFNNSDEKTAYFGFSVDGVDDDSARDALILNTVDWLLYGTQADNPPVVETIQNITVNENDLVILNVSATDPDGDELIYYYSPPFNGSGMWKTNYASSGIYTSSLIASDGVNNASTSFYVQVENVNRAPVLRTSLDTISFNETKVLALDTRVSNVTDESENENEIDEPLSIPGPSPVPCSSVSGNIIPICVEAYDLDNGNSVDNDDNQLSFTFSSPINSSGMWETNYDSSGIYTVQITVSDGELTDSENVTINVLNVNRPPEIMSVSTQPVELREGGNWEFSISAADPDGDNLTYSWYLDDNFVSAEKKFTYHPDFNSSGTHNITVTISDSEFEVSYSFIQEVLDVQGKTITLTAIKDSFVSQRTITNGKIVSLNFNDGGSWKLIIGHRMRVLVGFDLSGISTQDLKKATLVLTVNKTTHNWDVENNMYIHKILAEWKEGDGVIEYRYGEGSQYDPYHGIGNGVTWNCAIDSDISNDQKDCDKEWNGGKYASATDSILHRKGMKDEEVSWDVTKDILDGTENARFGWLIKKRDEGANGSALYYSRENAEAWNNMELAPRLVLEYYPSANENRAPAIESDYDEIAVNETEKVSFNLAVNDPDGDPFIIKTNMHSLLPSNFTLGATGLFEWTPTYDDSGEYDLWFMATDGDTFTEKHVKLTVKDVNKYIVLHASRDTMVSKLALVGKRNDSTNQNDGGYPILMASAYKPMRTLVGFDVNSSEIFAGNLRKATLVLTIANPKYQWGPEGGFIDAYRSWQYWEEGDAIVGYRPAPESKQIPYYGSGSGATWNCPIDLDISNRENDCEKPWLTEYDHASDSVVHTNGMRGEVRFDVTEDLSAISNDFISWIVKKRDEHVSGGAVYYSREGAMSKGNIDLAPRLILDYFPAETNLMCPVLATSENSENEEEQESNQTECTPVVEYQEEIVADALRQDLELIEQHEFPEEGTAP